MSILAGRNIQGEDECIQTMQDFVSSLQLPGTLKALGIDREQLSGMAETVSGNLLNDPASQEQDIIIKIYERAWGD